MADPDHSAAIERAAALTRLIFCPHARLSPDLLGAAFDLLLADYTHAIARDALARASAATEQAAAAFIALEAAATTNPCPPASPDTPAEASPPSRGRDMIVYDTATCSFNSAMALILDAIEHLGLPFETSWAMQGRLLHIPVGSPLVAHLDRFLSRTGSA